MEHLLRWPHVAHLLAWERDGLGYLASALVLATFCMKSMRWLRATAIVSNVGFISYALVVNLHPVLVLHCILLPVNIVRFVQIGLGRTAEARPPPRHGAGRTLNESPGVRSGTYHAAPTCAAAVASRRRRGGRIAL